MASAWCDRLDYAFAFAVPSVPRPSACLSVPVCAHLTAPFLKSWKTRLRCSCFICAWMKKHDEPSSVIFLASSVHFWAARASLVSLSLCILSLRLADWVGS